jgi:predicted nucleotidyltransferase component of viral defense system
MNGLAPQTSQVFDTITRLECIKPYVLVGGTALSIQLNMRLSEDLDFMSWIKKRNEKPEVEISAIKRELESVGHIDDMEIGGFNFVSFVFEGVKLSFYKPPRKQIPSMQATPFQNNLRLADIKSIGAMKMEAMLRRSKYRDYYDIYCILQQGIDFEEMVQLAIEHSGNLLKRKNLLAMLTNCDNYRKDAQFLQLQPVYDITPQEIEQYIKRVLLENKKV